MIDEKLIEIDENFGNIAKAVRRQMGVSGKNLAKYTTPTKTINGVTFTHNSDDSISVNGTPNGYIWFDLSNGVLLKAGTYTFATKYTGLATEDDKIQVINTTTDKIIAEIYTTVNTTKWRITTLTLTENTVCNVRYYCQVNATINNQRIYIMLLSGTYTDETMPQYEPYCKYTPSEIPSAIDNLVNQNKWTPQSNWWDIDEIIKNDNENYGGKLIILLTDEYETLTIQTNLGCNLIKTSDGATYSDFTSEIIHTWDSAYDKGKTRYVILYYTNNIYIQGAQGKPFSNSIYLIYKGNGTNYCSHTNEDGWHRSLNCKKIKFDNIKVRFFSAFNYNSCLVIENCDFYDRTSSHSINSYCLTDLSCNNIRNDFAIGNNLNLSYDSLLNIINALYDYSGTATTHTLTIGYFNKMKLTEIDVKKAELKGWNIV